MNDESTPPPHGETAPDDLPVEGPLAVAAELSGEFVAQVSTDAIAEAASEVVAVEPPAALPSAPAAAAAPDPIVEAVERVGRELGQRLDAMLARLDRESRAEETRERVVDRLHAELQDYKNDLLLRVMKPVFLDLIQLHDDLGKRAEALGDERFAAVLGEYQQAIEDILYRQGVEPLIVEDGPFDAQKQRAVATVPTEDPLLNKRVAARLRKGFGSGEKVIRPEMVTVYALKKG